MDYMTWASLLIDFRVLGEMNGNQQAAIAAENTFQMVCKTCRSELNMYNGKLMAKQHRWLIWLLPSLLNTYSPVNVGLKFKGFMSFVADVNGEARSLNKDSSIVTPPQDYTSHSMKTEVGLGT